MSQSVDQQELETVEKFHSDVAAITREIRKTIVGQQEAVDQVLVSLLTGSNSMITGVPGLAKTLLISTVAEVLHLKFNRIQFTPDLMPADITGTEIIEEDRATGRRERVFVKGPIFANIILADEINRTPPKTQAALLEAMQERTVTIEGNTYPLEPPFYVLATQNPIELEGTYPLPEAQLDRFMFNIKVDYPTAAEEEKILAQTTRHDEPEIRPILSAKAIVNVQKLVFSVATSEYIIKYVSRLVRATRPGDPSAPDYIRELVDWGAGPRAGQFLIHGGKALAAMNGRFSVAVEDIQKIAEPVLRHRISTNFQAQAEGMTNEDIIARLLQDVSLPEIPKFEK